MINRGACVYAGNDSVQAKKVAYYKDGQLIGYESSPKLRKKLGHGRTQYTIHPRSGGAEITIVSASSVQETKGSVYEGAKGSVITGAFTRREGVANGDGKIMMRGDSHGKFLKAAQGLRQKYTMDIRAFANVHDDGDAESGTQAESRQHFLDALRSLDQKYHLWAYAGHGWDRGLPSACMVQHGKGWSDFIGELKRVLLPNPTLVFYACSTGAPGGFAQAVCDALAPLNPTVFAHTCAGEGDTNPEKVMIRPGGVRKHFRELLGEDFVHWQCHIKSGNDIWRRFWDMSIDEIRAEVRHEDDDRGEHKHWHNFRGKDKAARTAQQKMMIKRDGRVH